MAGDAACGTWRRGRRPARSRQQGISLVLFTIGTLAIVAMAGLALDIGLGYLTKTRLQNALDAAALAAAERLNIALSEELATEEALAIFEENMGAFAGGVAPTLEFSPTLSPFAPGGADPRFVRVTATEVPSELRLASVLPGVGTTLSIAGTAVAGPAPLGDDSCGIPVALCGVSGDSDCSDGECFGYGAGVDEIQLKPAGPGAGMGPGNYGVVGCQGNACKDAIAGGTEVCFEEGETVTTQTGVIAGAIKHGLNTRFGDYGGGLSEDDYPPDVITTDNPVILFDTYEADLAAGNWDEPNGVPQRRVVLIPIVDCDPPPKGKTDVLVVGGMCVFVTQRADNQGAFWGEIVDRCHASGGGGPPAPGGGPGFRIILYKDPGSSTS